MRLYEILIMALTAAVLIAVVWLAYVPAAECSPKCAPQACQTNFGCNPMCACAIADGQPWGRCVPTY